MIQLPASTKDVNESGPCTNPESRSCTDAETRSCVMNHTSVVYVLTSGSDRPAVASAMEVNGRMVLQASAAAAACEFRS